MSLYLIAHGILFLSVFRMSCEALPLPDMELHTPSKDSVQTEVRAGEETTPGNGGISSAMSNLQSGVSTLFNASNMKESKLVVGGFSFFIIPSPDMQQLGQLNPGAFSQLLSLPGRK